MKREHAYLLPDVLCPAERLDICVSIPNNLGHILPFLAQIERLANWYAWEQNETRDNQTVADCWREVFNDVRAKIDAHIGCGDVAGVQDIRLVDCILEKQDSEGNWSTVGSIASCVTAGIEDALASGLIPPSPYPAYPSPEVNATNDTTLKMACGIADFVATYSIEKFNDILDLIESLITAGATVAKIAADVADTVAGWVPTVGGIISTVKDIIDGSVSVTFAIIRASDTVEWRSDVKCELYQRLADNGGTFGDTLDDVANGWIAAVEAMPAAIAPLYAKFLQTIDINGFRKWQKISEDNEGECDDCELQWTHTFDFTTGEHGWEPFNEWAAYADGQWNSVAHDPGSGTLRYLYLLLNIPAGADIRYVSAVITNSNVYQNMDDCIRGKDGEDWTGILLFDYSYTAGDGAVLLNTTIGGDMTGDATKCILLAMIGKVTAEVVVKSVTLKGINTEPTWV